jgi:hypothetical protein
MPFKEMICVRKENHAESINKNAELLIVKAAGTYSYHLAFNEGKDRMKTELNVTKVKYLPFSDIVK